MNNLEAKEMADRGQTRDGFESAEWTAWMRRALKNFNARARRTLKKIEGDK